MRVTVLERLSVQQAAVFAHDVQDMVVGGPDELACEQLDIVQVTPIAAHRAGYGQIVLGTDLEDCSRDPLTGFFRDGKCNTCGDDTGMHTVCVETTAEFLEYSKSVGNDLSTPIPEYQFPGLQPGDHWCLCLPRWIEAYNAGKAPRIRLKATHMSVIEFVPMDVLHEYALDGDA